MSSRSSWLTRTRASGPAVLLVLVLLVIAACGSPGGPGSGGTEPGVAPTDTGTGALSDENVIRIGAAIALSGRFASEGEELRAGYDLWADKVNNEWGGIDVGGTPHKVEMVYLDDESDPDTAARLVERLVSEEDVDFVFGPFSSGITIAVAPITERNDKIMMAGGAAANAVFSQGFEHIFGPYSLSSEYAKTALEALAEEGVKTVGIISTDEGALAELPEQTTALAEELGMEVVETAIVPADATDVSGPTRRLQSADPEVLFQMGQAQMAILMLDTLRQVGWSPQYVWNLGAFDPTLEETLGVETIQSILGPSHFHEAAGFEGELFGTPADYIEAYEEFTGGDTPGYFAPGASSAAMSLQLAIEAAGTLETEAVQQALFDLEIQDSYWGPINFSDPDDESGLVGANLAKGMLTVQIQPDGTKEVVAPADVATAELQPFTPWGER